MQVAHAVLGSSSAARASQQLRVCCRLQQQQHHHNSRPRSSAAAVAGAGLRSLEEAVAVAIPDALPNTNGLKQAYSSSAPAQQAEQLPSEIKSVLFSQQQVQAKVAELAAQICKDYKGKPLAIIGVLNGAFIFTSGKGCWGGVSQQRQWRPAAPSCAPCASSGSALRCQQ